MKSIMKKTVVLMVLLLGGLLHAQASTPIQHWQTAKGMRVYFVPTSGIPMLDVRLTFDAGSARDAGLGGLAVLTNGLLAEAAAGKSSQQIAEAFESVGAQFDNDALRDMALVSLRTLVEEQYRRPALDMFIKVVSQPDFTRPTFERERKRMLVSIRAGEQSPAEIASRAFYKALYGDHPYASPVSGTRQSVQRITLQDVRAFYEKYYVAANAVLSIVGEIDLAQAKRIVADIESSLPAGQRAAAIARPPALTAAKSIHIDYPSKQSHIYVGQLGMKRGDEDYFPLYLGNHPFGGSGFASRLVEVIREQKGLAYSVYSYFSPMREAGPFMMGMQTRTDQTGQALALLKDEFRRYLETGPDDGEVAASKSNITGSFPLNLDSNSKLLGYISMIGFYDLPVDYLDTFIDNIRSVSREQIRQALKKRLSADTLITVVVGPDGG